MTSVKLVPRRSVSITVENNSGVLQPSPTGAPSIKTTALVPAAGVSRFDQLDDVAEGSPVHGQVVIYDQVTDKYSPGELIEVDGGTF